MPFGTGNAFTHVGKGITAKRMLGATPAQAEAKYIGIGTGATLAARTAAVTDTVLSTEVETRAAGTTSTVTTAQTNDTFQVVGTVTATATRAVDEAAVFDASSGGGMLISSTFAVVNLQNGDAIQLTFKLQVS